MDAPRPDEKPESVLENATSNPRVGKISALDEQLNENRGLQNVLFHPITRLLSAVLCVVSIALAIICAFQWEAYAYGVGYAVIAFVWGWVALWGGFKRQSGDQN